MRRRFHLKYSIIGAILLVIYSPYSVQPTETVLEAMVDSSAKMPCAVVQKADDSVEFIFWYKNDGVNALYTLDARRRALSEASHVRNDTYGDRVQFHVTPEEHYLQLDSLRPEDSGDYFCRVDYQWSATDITKVNLVVIVPPKKLIIRDDSGQEIQNIAGPYRERSTISLSCEAQKGVPSPNVTWWRDNKVWDNTFQKYSTGVLNDMKLNNLSRTDLFATFHCKAQNTKLTLPVVRTIVLDMYLYPVSTRITTRLGPLAAGHPLDIQCESRGSRPSARVSWWLDERPISGHLETVHDNATTSRLRLHPKPEQHGRRLACRATNEKMKGDLEDARVLNVTYIPIVSLRLIKEEDGRQPKEDDYIRLVCDIRANPPAYKVDWLVDDSPVDPNNTATDVVSGNTLVFKRLTRRNKGRYRCRATNQQGIGMSHELMLNISHAPVCKPNQQITYAVSLNESAAVRCEVEADPPAVTFKWEFSNTVHKHYDLRHEGRGVVSTAHYTPATTQDYGTLFCWANNSVGHQQSSCFFTVIAPACKTENVEVNASSLSRDGSESVWPHSVLTTGAGVLAFAVVVAAACAFYCRRIYLERKHRGPMGPILEEEISIYNRAQYHNGPQPHILITK